MHVSIYFHTDTHTHNLTLKHDLSIWNNFNVCCRLVVLLTKQGIRLSGVYRLQITKMLPPRHAKTKNHVCMFFSCVCLININETIMCVCC